MKLINLSYKSESSFQKDFFYLLLQNIYILQEWKIGNINKRKVKNIKPFKLLYSIKNFILL